MQTRTRADILVDEVELDLLERRGRPGTARRSARSAAGRSSASPPATPIISCSRMPTLTTRSGCGARPARTGRRRCRPARPRRAGRRRAAGGGVDEALPHRRSSLAPRATTTCGRPGGGRERALERVVVAAVDGRRGPAVDGEPRGDAARPAVGGGRVVDDDTVSASRPTRRRRRSPRGWSPRPARRRRSGTKTRGSVRALGAQAERDADGERQAVAERAGARSRRPARGRSGWWPSGESKPPRPSSQPRGRSPWPRGRRSRPAARGPSRAGSGRGRGRRRSAGSTRSTRS